jgi:hypothetical protein
MLIAAAVLTKYRDFERRLNATLRPAEVATAGFVAVDSVLALAVVHWRRREVVMSTLSRRTFVTALGMLSVPLFALAQENKDREEKKDEAKEKKEEAKDKAEDAVEDRDQVVDGPGTDRSQDRRQDRRRDAVK